MTPLTIRRTAPGGRPRPTWRIARPGGTLPRLFLSRHPAAAAAAPSPATELPDLSTSHEPASGGGPLQEHAGNTNPSARASKNVAGPAQNAEVRGLARKIFGLIYFSGRPWIFRARLTFFGQLLHFSGKERNPGLPVMQR